jgi:hypothetical protein
LPQKEQSAELTSPALFTSFSLRLDMQWRLLSNSFFSLMPVTR